MTNLKLVCYLQRMPPQQEFWQQTNLLLHLVLRRLKQIKITSPIKLGHNPKDPPQISGKTCKIQVDLPVCLDLIMRQQVACSLPKCFQPIKVNNSLTLESLLKPKICFSQSLNPNHLLSRKHFNSLSNKHSNNNNHRLSNPFPNLKPSKRAKLKNFQARNPWCKPWRKVNQNHLPRCKRQRSKTRPSLSKNPSNRCKSLSSCPWFKNHLSLPTRRLN